MRYLGVSLVAAKTTKCNLQTAKQSYFKALNGIFGSIGAKSDIAVILSLINSFCLPILTYGFDAIKLNKASYSTLESAYTTAFAKIFHTYNGAIIRECQLHCGCLPIKYLIDLKRINFLCNLPLTNNTHIRTLYMRHGVSDLNRLLSKYGILVSDSLRVKKLKMWRHFESSE